MRNAFYVLRQELQGSCVSLYPLFKGRLRNLAKLYPQVFKVARAGAQLLAGVIERRLIGACDIWGGRHDGIGARLDLLLLAQRISCLTELVGQIRIGALKADVQPDIAERFHLCRLDAANQSRERLR